MHNHHEGHYRLVSNALNGKRAAFQKRVIFLPNAPDQQPSLFVEAKRARDTSFNEVTGADATEAMAKGHLQALADWIQSE